MRSSMISIAERQFDKTVLRRSTFASLLLLTSALHDSGINAAASKLGQVHESQMEGAVPVTKCLVAVNGLRRVR